jgi:hypothetical protein
MINVETEKHHVNQKVQTVRKKPNSVTVYTLNFSSYYSTGSMFSFIIAIIFEEYFLEIWRLCRRSVTYVLIFLTILLPKFSEN